MEREDQLFWSKEVYVRTFSNSSSPVCKGKCPSQFDWASVWSVQNFLSLQFNTAETTTWSTLGLRNCNQSRACPVKSTVALAMRTMPKIRTLPDPGAHSPQALWSGAMATTNGEQTDQTFKQSVGGFGAEWSRPTNFSGAHSTGNGQCFGRTSRNRWLGRFLSATISTKWTFGTETFKELREDPTAEHGVLQQLLIRTPPSTEVQGTETISELQEVFHGPLPSRNGSNKGSCGTLRYHHNQWRNQASYFYILASLILRAWMQCSWVRMRTWRVTSLHWTWHTQRRPLFQAMCGRDCPVLLGTERIQAVLIKSKCWTMFHHVEDQGSLQCEHKGHERQLGWPLLTLVDIHYEWCSVLVLPSYNTFNLTLNHWCWGSELIARNLLGVTPNDGRVGHSNPPTY